MGLRALQGIAFCFYLHFTQCPNIFQIGVELAHNKFSNNRQRVTNELAFFFF